MLLFLASGAQIGVGPGFYAGILVVDVHLAWQVTRLDINNGANCLSVFKSNRDLGLIMFLAIVAA